MSTVSVRIAFAESYLCNLLLFSKIKTLHFTPFVIFFKCRPARVPGKSEELVQLRRCDRVRAVVAYWSTICKLMRGKKQIFKK